MEVVIILSTNYPTIKIYYLFGSVLIVSESLVQEDYRMKKLYFDSWHHGEAVEVKFLTGRKIEKKLPHYLEMSCDTQFEIVKS